jgi:hypothetical protein
MKVKRVEVYFYNGHEFNTVWINAKTSGFAFGYSSGDFLKDYKLKGGIGLLKKGWQRQRVNQIIREYISTGIQQAKFMQSRNFGN